MALDPMKGMIASYLASPRGQETVRNFLSSPEGKKAICDYIRTPQGSSTLQLILPDILNGLCLPEETRETVLKSIAEKK